jgi:hypothetical protein
MSVEESGKINVRDIPGRGHTDGIDLHEPRRPRTEE